VPNPNLELVPGMYAAVALKVQRRTQALSIPIEALSMGTTNTVYLVNGDQKIEQRGVTLGLETPTRCEVTSGLKEGDTVMIGTRTQIPVGQKVETKPWQAPALE
jgi:Fe2+ transport system protein FeoA